jgi:hypothetical protein
MKLTKTQLKEIIREEVRKFPLMENQNIAIKIAELENQRKDLIRKQDAILIKQKELINKGTPDSEYPWEDYDRWPAKLKMEVAKLDIQLEKVFAEIEKNFKKLMKLKGTWR